MATAAKAYEFQKAIGFLLRFKREFMARGMLFEMGGDSREIRFEWQGCDMQLTAMDNGYIMAAERKKRFRSMCYDITSDRAIWLSDFIASIRKKMGW